MLRPWADSTSYSGVEPLQRSGSHWTRQQTWLSTWLGPLCTPFPKGRMMCGQLPWAKHCGDWYPSVYARQWGTLLRTCSPPSKLGLQCPWAERPPCTRPGSGCTVEEGMPPTSSWRWTSTTRSTQLTGLPSFDKFGCTCLGWHPGRNGATAATVASYFMGMF